MKIFKEALIAVAMLAVIIAVAFLTPLPAHAQGVAGAVIDQVVGAATTTTDSASSAAPVTPADGNYTAALQATVLITQQQSNATVAAAAARAQCYRSLADLVASPGTASDTAKVAAVVALGIACNGGVQLAAASGPGPVQIPAPPAQPVQVAQGNWLQALVNAPAALLDGAVKIAPMAVQYLLGRVNAESQTRIALAQSAERSGLYQVFGGINQSSMNAISSATSQGFITIGQLPAGHNTTVNVTGSSGIGFGSGTVTYNPITSSYNPSTVATTTNPTPRVCAGTPITCS